MDFAKITLDIIGTIYNDRKEVSDDHWGNVISTIKLNPSLYQTCATQGLKHFSHLELAFIMHQVNDEKIINGARHPRNQVNLPKVGILAQRAKSRPNRVAISRAEIMDVNELTITVKGLDAIDQSLVIGIKPYTLTLVPNEQQVHEPAWLATIMKNYF